MSKIKNLLNGDAPKNGEKKVIRPSLLETMAMTEGALEKAKTYSKLAIKKAGKPIEIYGYLITPLEETDFIIRDVYLAPDQKVSHSSVDIDGNAVSKSGEDIQNMGYKVLGWWHSHGTMRSFFSGKDDRNIMKVLNKIAPSNYIVQLVEKVMRKNNEGIFCAGEMQLELEDAEQELLEQLAQISIKIPRMIGFTYGLTVNGKDDDVHVEIATREWCGICNDFKTRGPNEIGLKLLKVEDGITYNEEEMEEEIGEKVELPKWYQSWGYGGGDYGAGYGYQPPSTGYSGPSHPYNHPQPAAQQPKKPTIIIPKDERLIGYPTDSLRTLLNQTQKRKAHLEGKREELNEKLHEWRVEKLKLTQQDESSFTLNAKIGFYEKQRERYAGKIAKLNADEYMYGTEIGLRTGIYPQGEYWKGKKQEPSEPYHGPKAPDLPEQQPEEPDSPTLKDSVKKKLFGDGQEDKEQDTAETEKSKVRQDSASGAEQTNKELLEQAGRAFKRGHS